MRISQMFRHGLLAGLLGITSLFGFAAQASATPIPFTATTTGCFGKDSINDPTKTPCTPAHTATLDDLTFTGGSDSRTLVYPPNTTISDFALGTFAITNTTGANANIQPGSD